MTWRKWGSFLKLKENNPKSKSSHVIHCFLLVNHYVGKENAPPTMGPHKWLEITLNYWCGGDYV